MKCDCCKKEIKENEFIWHTIPALGFVLKHLCDNCALSLITSFIEENGLENSRMLAGKEEEYQKCLEMLKQLKNKQA